MKLVNRLQPLDLSRASVYLPGRITIGYILFYSTGHFWNIDACNLLFTKTCTVLIILKTQKLSNATYLNVVQPAALCLKSGQIMPKHNVFSNQRYFWSLKSICTCLDIRHLLQRCHRPLKIFTDLFLPSEPCRLSFSSILIRPASGDRFSDTVLAPILWIFLHLRTNLQICPKTW